MSRGEWPSPFLPTPTPLLPSPPLPSRLPRHTYLVHFVRGKGAVAWRAVVAIIMVVFIVIVQQAELALRGQFHLDPADFPALRVLRDYVVRANE